MVIEYSLPRISVISSYIIANKTLIRTWQAVSDDHYFKKKIFCVPVC